MLRPKLHTALAATAFLFATGIESANALSPGDIVIAETTGLNLGVSCDGSTSDFKFCRVDAQTGDVELLVSVPEPLTGRFALETQFEPDRHTIFATRLGHVIEIDVATGTASEFTGDIGAFGVSLTPERDLLVTTITGLKRVDRDSAAVSTISEGGLLEAVLGNAQLFESDYLLPDLYNGVIRVDALGNQSVFSNPIPNFAISAIDVSRSGEIYVGDHHGRLYQLDELGQATFLDDMDLPIVDIDVAENGDLVFSWYDIAVFRWDPTSGEPVSIADHLIHWGHSAEVVFPECSDGIDNNGDGPFDYPDDPFCLSANDNREGPGRCGLGFELTLCLAPLMLRRRTREVQA